MQSANITINNSKTSKKKSEQRVPSGKQKNGQKDAGKKSKGVSSGRQKQEQQKDEFEEQDQQEYIGTIDRDKLEYCKYKDCPQQAKFGPHKHYLKQCETHAFCEMEKGCNMVDTEQSLAFPLHHWGEKNIDVKRQAKNVRVWRKNQSLDKRQKVVVTAQSLDYWYAQNFGLDIHNLPPYNIFHTNANMSEEERMSQGFKKRIYEQLKKRYKKGGARAESVEPPTLTEEEKAAEEDNPNIVTNKSLVPWVTDPKELKPMFYPKSRPVKDLADHDTEQLRTNVAPSDNLDMSIIKNLNKQSNAFKALQNNNEKVPAKDQKPSNNDLPGPSAEQQNKQSKEIIKKTNKTMTNGDTIKVYKHSQPDQPLVRIKVYSSPHVNTFLDRQDVIDTVGRIKKIKDQIKENFEQKEAQDLLQQESISTSFVQGSAKFVNVKKNVSKSVENKQPRYQKTKKVTSTFQKLQSLRKNLKDQGTQREQPDSNQSSKILPISPDKFPLHTMIKQASKIKGLNHFKDIQAQALDDFMQSQKQSASLRSPVSYEAIKHFSKDGRQEFQQHSEADSTLSYVAMPQNKSKFDTFVQSFNQDASFQASTSSVHMPRKNTFQTPRDLSLQIPANLFRQIDNQNMDRAREYNLSILSPSINQRKDRMIQAVKSFQNGYAGGKKMQKLISESTAKSTDVNDLATELRSKIEKDFKERSRVMIKKDIETDLGSAEKSHDKGPVRATISRNKQLKSILGKIHLTEKASNKVFDIAQGLHKNQGRNSVTGSHQEIFSTLYRKNLFLRKHAEKYSGTALSKDTRDSTAMVGAKSGMHQVRAASHLVQQNRNIASPLFSSKQQSGDPTKLREYLNATADQAPADQTYDCSHSNSIENMTNKRLAFTPLNDVRSPQAKQINSITFVNPPPMRVQESTRKSQKGTNHVNFYGDQGEGSHSVGKPTATQSPKSQQTQSKTDSKRQIEKHQAPVFAVNPLDIEYELQEPLNSELERSNQQVNVILDLQMPDPTQLGKNVFECAEYWLSNGYQAQTGKSLLQAMQTDTANMNPQQQREERKKQEKAQDSQSTQVDRSDQALDFYYQGLRKDASHFGCTYNVGVTFMQKGKNRNAQKWFGFARKMQPERKEPYLGEAISSLKLGQIDKCIMILKMRPGQKLSDSKKKKSVIGLIGETSETEEESGDPDICCDDNAEQKEGEEQDNDEEEKKESTIVLVKLDIENQFTFLQAICYKKAQQFAKSQKEYKKLEEIFQSRQGFRLAKNVFTNLMLPLQINRKVVEDYVQSFVDNISIKDKEIYWDQKYHDRINEILNFKHKSWTRLDLTPSNIDINLAIPFFKTKPFFRRLTSNGCSKEDFKDLIQDMKLVSTKCGEIIFNDQDSVHMVLNGRVVLRFHEEDPLEYQYIAQYTPGTVIGHDTLDGGMSQMGQVFAIVTSSKCVLLKMSKKVFIEKMWNKAKNQQKEIMIRQLRQYKLMEELCDQTLYNIVYEYGKIKLFKPDQIVLKCHVRSALSVEGRKIYDEEYGSHMKNEANKIMAGISTENQAEQSLAKASAFGSFFHMVNQIKKKREADGIPEPVYHVKSDVYVPGNPPASNIRSLSLILDGSCKVVSPLDGFAPYELRQGEHFGASDLLQIPDIEFMGDIISGSHGVKLLTVEAPDQVIQLWERKNLQEKLKSQHDLLKILIENKYAASKPSFNNY